MKKCPECSGDHPIFKDYGNGTCSRCYEVKIHCAMPRGQKGGSDLAGVVDIIERCSIECSDCYGTSTCQYCVGFGFVP